MKKRSLVSILVCLVLICALTLGIFVPTASAKDLAYTVLYTTGDVEKTADSTHFAAFSEALSAADKKSGVWKADDVLEIRFSGEISGGADNGVLFAQKTIWREDGTKLPIIIRGVDQSVPKDAFIYLDVAGGWYACANDYTFVNLTMPIGMRTTKFYAGSGNITFQNVSFKDVRNVTVPTIEEQTEMYNLSHELALYMGQTHGVDIAPSATAWQIARANEAIGDTLNATAKDGVNGDWKHDGNVGGGMYLNACVWYEVLTKTSCVGNAWRPATDTVGYALDEAKIPHLQAAAHQAVTERYGAEYYTTGYNPDTNGDGKLDVVVIGSSNGYYFPDELAHMLGASGYPSRIASAYIASISVQDQWAFKQAGDKKYQLFVYEQGKTTTASQNAVLKNYGIEDVLAFTDWDAMALFETANIIDDFGLKLANHETQLNKLKAKSADAEDFYAYLAEENDDARLLWYEVPAPPVGAYGSNNNDPKLYGYIYADTCTDAVFQGWPELPEGEKVKTSITFADGASYRTADITRVAAVSYGPTDKAMTPEEQAEMRYPASGLPEISDIRPIDMECSIIIKGASSEVYYATTKLGGAPSTGIVEMYDGWAYRLCGDNNTESVIENYHGDSIIRMYGGELENSIYHTWKANVDGNLITEVEGTAENPVKIGGSVRNQWFGTVTGYSNTTIKYAEIVKDLHLGGGSKDVVNVIENATVTGGILGSRHGTPTKITNTLKNVTAGNGTDAFYGGHYDGTVKGDVVNDLTDCTFKGATIMGNWTKGTVEGSVISTLKNVNSNGVTSLGCSEAACTVKGDITGHVTDSTFSNIFYAAAYKAKVVLGKTTANLTGVEFTFANQNLGCYFGGSNGAGGTYGDIENNLTDCTFATRYFGGNRANATAGNVVNNIDSCTFKNYYYGGGEAGKVMTIKNVVKDTDHCPPTTGNDYCYFFGGNKAATFSEAPEGVERPWLIYNDIDNLKLAKRYFGASHTSATPGKVINDITNILSGANLYMGAQSGKVDVIESTLRGTIRGNVCGGSNAGSADTISTTLDGVASLNYFFGGHNWSDTAIAKNITTTVKNSNVTNFYGGHSQIGHMTEDADSGIKNIIISGTVTNFSGGNRNNTTASGKFTRVENEIRGGTITSFYGYGSAKAESGSVTNTVSGGTVQNFFGATNAAAFTGEVNTTVTGGILENVKCAENTGAVTGSVNFTIKPVGDVTVKGSVDAAKETERVNLVGDKGRILLGASSSIIADSAEGTIRLLQTEEWKLQDYLTLSAGNTAKVITKTADGATGAWMDETGGALETLRIYGTDLVKTPAAKATSPTLSEAGTDFIALTAEEGYEYSLDGATWQESATFTGLESGKAYTFYRRLAESATALAGEASDGATFETKSYVVGDMDGSGEVDSDDAIYLLFYTLFEEDYPIDQPADFDGSGEVDSDDAIYLLFHTLFEEDYPL